MIHIRREPSTADALISRTIRPKGTLPATRAERELEKAIAFFSPPPVAAKVAAGPGKKAISKMAATKAAVTKATPTEFKFSVYKDKDLAAQLRRMFFGKCAYCDSCYRHVSSTDIEHFRPKGAIVINGALESPGYYWLAATWENLFPSCPLCNRAGDYEKIGSTTTERGGKGCEFPLLDESKRVRKHGVLLDDEDKHRLLLNPCADKPEDVLDYLDTGAVVAKLGLAALDHRRAAESIRVYGLFRGELVERRKEKMVDLDARLDAVDDASDTLNWMVRSGIAASRIAKQGRRLAKEIAALRKMFAPKSPYLGLLRFQIRSQLGDKRAKRLKRRGIDINDLLS